MKLLHWTAGGTYARVWQEQTNYGAQSQSGLCIGAKAEAPCGLALFHPNKIVKHHLESDNLRITHKI